MINRIMLGYNFFLLLIISIGCQSIQKEKNSDNKVMLIVKQEIAPDQQASENLYSIYPIASASISEDIIALANYRNPISITLIDYEGSFIEQIGSEGQGPGEIQSARFIGLDNQDNVVINDKISALIKKYDRSDNSVHSFNNLTEEGIDITSRDMKQCGENWILSINYHEYAPSDTSSIVGIFNEKFEIVETFGSADPFLSGKKSILQDPMFSIDCESRQLYTTHIKVPFIQIYDLDDRTQKERIAHIPPSFRLSDKFIDMIENEKQMEYRNFLIDEQSVSLLLSHNENYIMLFYRNDTEIFYETRNFMDREHYVAVYSKENLSFLGETTIEGAALGTTKEGYLITLVNDDPVQLDLIEVVVDEIEN